MPAKVELLVWSLVWGIDGEGVSCFNGHNRQPSVGLHKKTTQQWENNPIKWPNSLNPAVGLKK